MSDFVDKFIFGLSPIFVYLCVFWLPALEASIFLGFVLPGETAIVVGGAIASQNRVNIGVVIALAIAGAIIGDNIGYEVGRRFGPKLQLTRAGRWVGESKWKRTEHFLHKYSAASVFFGRFTALLRALVPSVAGMSRIPYRRFIFWNAVGGSIWATVFCMLGYVAGTAYKKFERAAGEFSIVFLFVVVAILITAHFISQRRENGKTKGDDDANESTASA